MLARMMKYASRSVVSNIQACCTSAANAKKLDGKVAIVTASTDGQVETEINMRMRIIGFAIAKNLAENGASVVISSRKQKNVDTAVEKLKSEGLNKIVGVVCNVGNATQRNNLFETAIREFGGLDILVSNAAVNPQIGPVLECTEEVWDKSFEINVKAGYLLAKQAVPHLKKRGGGSIVFVSSIVGYQSSKVPFKIYILGVYAVSKTALFGLTKAASLELATENIRVNCLAPGIVATKFAAAITTGPAKEVALSMIPMNRLGKPEDMGGVVTFLCSDDASYITGETIVVAGGMTSRL
ncbi:hypothetical protein RUM43_014671 [Polyplax serrata]|uniref:Dehydrogenase/reductase SDR family member 4 n=1 Tax=Polyplax serrata TaxID=468196 RepID=A0AAN8PB27_POLSC